MDIHRYVHYWHRVVEFPEKSFGDFALDVQALLASNPSYTDPALKTHLRGWNGYGDPAINNELVEFNGDAGLGVHHETFTFPRSIGITELMRSASTTINGILYWDFIKTAMKPYNLPVMCSLIFACLRLGTSDFDVTSLGCTMAIRSTASMDQWDDAFSVARTVLLSSGRILTGGVPELDSRLAHIRTTNIDSPGSIIT